MNAASQRRLTPVLGGIAAILAIVWVVLLGGIGRTVHWNPPLPTPPLPETHNDSGMPAAQPLERYAVIWQKPLFNPDRKPVLRAAGESSNLGDMELTGIIMTSTLRMALLHGKDGDKELRIREGNTSPDGGIKLAELHPRSAVFEVSGTRTELKLPAGAPVTPLPKAAANGTPTPLGAVLNPSTDNGNPPQMQVRHVPPGVQPVPAPGNQPAGQNAEQADRIRQLRENILKRRAQQAATPEGVR
jgi:general secretion pathway protein N